MICYLRKLHAYGLKFTVAVKPNDLASFLSRPFESSVHSLAIFHSSLPEHKACTANAIVKWTGKANEHGIKRNIYPNNWTILANKGYLGAAEQIRIITSHKAIL